MRTSFKIRCCSLSPLLKFVRVSSSLFSPLGWTLASISASKITPKSIQDHFDTSKSSQEAPKTDFGAPKSRPKAFDSAPRSLPKGVLEAPKRLLVRLLDRVRHHQEGFITIQTHSDLSLLQRYNTQQFSFHSQEVARLNIRIIVDVSISTPPTN